jgi:hypothetical protein
VEGAGGITPYVLPVEGSANNEEGSANKEKVIKKLQNSRNQGFSYYFA